MLKHGFTPGTLIDGDESLRKLRSMFRNLETEILNVARRERVLRVRYLKQEKCFDTGKPALCDIGWKGNLQKAFASVIKSERARMHRSWDTTWERIGTFCAWLPSTASLLGSWWTLGT
jgi:hypothetical protein